MIASFLDWRHRNKVELRILILFYIDADRKLFRPDSFRMTRNGYDIRQSSFASNSFLLSKQGSFYGNYGNLLVQSFAFDFYLNEY